MVSDVLCKICLVIHGQYPNPCSTRSTNCEARFSLRCVTNFLMITSCHVIHNHPRSKFIYDRLPSKRRLTDSELAACEPLLVYNTSSADIKEFVANKFGKFLSTKDVGNYRRKVRPPFLSKFIPCYRSSCSDDLESVLRKLRETGRVSVESNSEGYCSHVCFARHQQIALFRRFPDVVNVDATHGTNKLR